MLTVVFLVFFSDNIVRSSGNLSTGDLDIAGVTSFLEQQHGVRIFYQPQWFDGVSFAPQTVELSLPLALESITRDLGLDVAYIGEIIVIMPADERLEERMALDREQTIVGDLNQYGRYSRATVTGTVRDGATGEVLIGAVVYEPESEEGATTDVSGSFRMELPVGNHRLRLSYIGYEERYYDVRLVSDGRATFELFSETIYLDPFVLEAQRAQDNVLRSQMSVVTMDAQTLRELPATFGEQDIVRSMTMLPGVQSVGEFGTGFNVRGGSADQNLILIENVPLFNASHLFGLISVINPDMVSNVTLMKAGIPARYGERASSVMDVRLNAGLDRTETSIRGGLGLINSRLLLQTPVVEERATFSFGARSSYSDWLLNKMPDEDLMNSTARFHDFTAITNIALNPRNYLNLFGYYSYDRFGFLEEQTIDYSNILSSLRWNRIIHESLSSTLILGWSRYEYQVLEQPHINELLHSRMESSLDYKSLKALFSWQPWRDHSLEFGGNLIHYNIHPGELSPFGESSTVMHELMDAEQAVEMSVFVSDDMALGELVQMELGFRYTHYLQLGPATVNLYEEGKPMNEQHITGKKDYGQYDIVSSYGGLEPRFGLRYRTGEASSAKVSYNRINQYINLISNTSVISPTDLWKLSDTHIKPLRSDQYAIGYFQNFLDNTIETSLEAYYRNFHNSIEYSSGAEIVMNELLETDVINAKGYGYGVELYVRKNTGRLTGWTSYTFSSSMRRSQEGFREKQINRNRYFPSNYDRPHNLVVNLNYNISRRWRFGASFTYSSGRPVTLPELSYTYGRDYLIYYSDRNKYRLPDYHRLDLSITLGQNLRTDQSGKGSWTLSLMNVYGRKNPYSLFYRREPAGAGSHRSFNLYQLYIIGRPLPTITYNYSI